MVIDNLLIALERAEKFSGRFQYKVGSETYTISTSDIIYFRSMDRMIRIITTTGEDVFYSSLENVQKEVSRHRFILIHRSYLVNYKHVTTRRYNEVVMSNEDVIPISRSKRKELRNLQIIEE